jgi:ankyrin repeat protein
MTMNTKLRDAVQADHPEAIEESLAEVPADRFQDELNDSLILAMPTGSHATIKLLLDHGAKLKRASFHAAMAREDTGVLQLLVDSGWDIDSNEFTLSAVQ